MKEKPILSISLLSSGRNKTLKKCLDSLVPLMEAVDSELILVDTGCDEEMQKLMREYTEQIIPFTWCNDFSKARNAGLEKANGEWFLYLDDDEWFIDVNQIVAFFKSGDYRNYGSADYIQRNYRDYQEKRYSDAWVSRMVRLDGKVRFVSSIHEYLYPVSGKKKLLDAAVKHFGYIFDSEEEKRKHSRRNISLLLDMIEKERLNIRWWVQIANEYRGIEEFQRLQELCEEGLEVFQKYNNGQVNRDRGCLYVGRMLADVVFYQWDEAIKSYQNAMADERNTDMCRAGLQMLAAEAYINLERYEECETCCRNYLRIYHKLKDNVVELRLQGAFLVREAFEDEERGKIYSYLICCGLKRKDTGALKEFFSCIGWEKERVSIQNELIPSIIEAMAELDYEEEFVSMVQTMVNRKGVDDVVWKQVLQQEKKAQELPEPERFERLLRIFSQVESDYYYCWYLKICYADVCNASDELEHFYKKLFDCVSEIFLLDDSVYSIAEKNHVDLGKLFDGISFDKWRRGVDGFCENTSLDRLHDRTEIILRAWGGKTDNVRCAYFMQKAAEAEIIYSPVREDYYAMRERFQTFCVRCLNFYGLFFKETAFHGEMELLPPACRAAVLLQQLLTAQEAGDRKLAGEYIKKVMGVFPSFDAAIMAYAKLYAEEEQSKLSEKNKQAEEMKILATQIKEKVRFLIEQGEKKSAGIVLEQLTRMAGEDAETQQLKAQCEEEI